MRYGMREPCSLNGRSYAARVIDLNECLSLFPGENGGGKTYETELNEILLNSIPKSWSRQVYALGFDHETITLKKCEHV